MEQARERFRQAGSKFKTPAQGAATSVLLATSPLLDGVGGRYFEDCNEAEIVSPSHAGRDSRRRAHALDPANADRLWAVSERMLAAGAP
jgi:hypothetical protein